MKKNISLKQIKKQTYSEQRKDFDFEVSFWVYYVTRPLSFFLTSFLLKTSVTANSVTIFSLFICILSCFYLCIGTYQSFILGALFYNFFLILDSVDGNIARYKNQSSNQGTLLDALVGDMINVLILPSICVGLINSNKLNIIIENSEINVEIIFILILVSTIANLFTTLFFQRVKIIFNTTSKKANTLFKERNFFKKIITYSIRNAFGFSFIAPSLLVFTILNLTEYLLFYLFAINILIFIAVLMYAIYLIFYSK